MQLLFIHNNLISIHNKVVSVRHSQLRWLCTQRGFVFLNQGSQIGSKFFMSSQTVLEGTSNSNSWMDTASQFTSQDDERTFQLSA